MQLDSQSSLRGSPSSIRCLQQGSCFADFPSWQCCHACSCPEEFTLAIAPFSSCQLGHVQLRDWQMSVTEPTRQSSWKLRTKMCASSSEHSPRMHRKAELCSVVPTVNVSTAKPQFYPEALEKTDMRLANVAPCGWGARQKMCYMLGIPIAESSNIREDASWNSGISSSKQSSLHLPVRTGNSACPCALMDGHMYCTNHMTATFFAPEARSRGSTRTACTAGAWLSKTSTELTKQVRFMLLLSCIGGVVHARDGIVAMVLEPTDAITHKETLPLSRWWQARKATLKANVSALLHPAAYPKKSQ